MTGCQSSQREGHCQPQGFLPAQLQSWLIPTLNYMMQPAGLSRWTVPFCSWPSKETFPLNHPEWFPKRPIGQCFVICPTQTILVRRGTWATSLSNRQETEQLPTCGKGIGQSICTLFAVVPRFPSLGLHAVYLCRPLCNLQGWEREGYFLCTTYLLAQWVPLPAAVCEPSCVVTSAVPCLCILREGVPITPAKPKTITF